MASLSKRLNRPPAIKESRNTCWAASLASLEWATWGEVHFPEEFLLRYKTFCSDTGALLGQYLAKVLKGENLSYEVVQGQDFGIDSLYGRMTHGEFPKYHLLIFKYNEDFTHCVVIYGIERQDGWPERIYVMNPLYEADQCYREMLISEFRTAQAGNPVLIGYYL